jgi:hypothetical protein
LYSANRGTITHNVLPINDPPTGGNSTVVTDEETSYTFALNNFPFNDIEGDSMTHINVTVLPNIGDLFLDGIEIGNNTPVSVADITAGRFIFTPMPCSYGSPYSTFQYRVWTQPH